MANNYSPLQPRNTRIITRPNGAAEFLITDHLGSTRLSIKANHLPTELTPTVYQDTKYYAFGDVRESDGQGARTGYIGREVDSESDLGAYGVRNYESATGRFLSTDVLWEKYLGLNPYHYCADNPVTATDASGLDLIILVAPEGASGYGHAAVLVGNKDKGYQYVSFDGTDNITKVHGEGNVTDLKFASLEEFQSEHNAKRDNKYEVGFEISEDEETDKKFLAGARKVADKSGCTYDLWDNSCIDVVSSALKNAGYWGGDQGLDTPNDRVKQVVKSMVDYGMSVGQIDFTKAKPKKVQVLGKKPPENIQTQEKKD